eukprot:COSAG02_NODE_980_length_15492_cov_12.941727_4_plen_135_part_00
MKLNSTARKKVCKKQGAKRAGRQEPLLGAVRGRRAGADGAGRPGRQCGVAAAAYSVGRASRAAEHGAAGPRCIGQGGWHWWCGTGSAAPWRVGASRGSCRAGSGAELRPALEIVAAATRTSWLRLPSVGDGADV